VVVEELVELLKGRVEYEEVNLVEVEVEHSFY